VRRISAILLLVAFSLPLIAAPFTDSDSSLPACCRRAGKHNCSMGAGDPSSGPSFARRDCPYLPALSCMLAPVAPVLPQSSLAVAPSIVSHAAVLASGHDCGNTCCEESHPKRGPPSLS